MEDLVDIFSHGLSPEIHIGVMNMKELEHRDFDLYNTVETPIEFSEEQILHPKIRRPIEEVIRRLSGAFDVTEEKFRKAIGYKD